MKIKFILDIFHNYATNTKTKHKIESEKEELEDIYNCQSSSNCVTITLPNKNSNVFQMNKADVLK